MAGGMLEGVKIVDLTSVVIGPLATQILADNGAEVIKVESPEGDIGRWLSGRGRSADMGPKFLHLNRNKRSICLDLKLPAARDVLMRLLADADVMTWNIRPAAMARLGLSYDAVREVKPDIVYCGMFGFGQGGPYADMPAYDPIIQGASGVAALNEMAFGEPRFLPYVLADRTCGLIAVQMIAMALFHRERTGQGQSIEVPMFENMVTQVLTEQLYLRTFVPPLGPAGDPRLLNHFYAPSKTLDGYISLTANTNDQVYPLMEAMGFHSFRDDPRFNTVAARFANVAEYFKLRAEGLRTQTTAHWLAVCRRHDIPAAPYHTLESLIEDPHLKAVGLLREVEHPTEGRLVDIAPANSVSSGPRRDWLPAPRLGEHTESVLVECGYSRDEVDALLAQGAARRAPTPDMAMASGGGTP
jgi:crotonobetainyl-CoA:carnitine CoA-transferase CaiB-like acyl-CoA transferase